MTGQSLAAIRLLCFLPKSSPFRRAIRGRAFLCPGKSMSTTPSCSEEMVKAIRVHELGGSRGMEAVGEVVAVGPGLTGRKVGDIVAYAGHPMGSYAEEQILPASKAIRVPPLY